MSFTTQVQELLTYADFYQLMSKRFIIFLSDRDDVKCYVCQLN